MVADDDLAQSRRVLEHAASDGSVCGDVERAVVPMLVPITNTGFPPAIAEIASNACVPARATPASVAGPLLPPKPG
jgi:hypothetical protein